MSYLRNAQLIWVDNETLRSANTELLAVFDERSREIESSPERFLIMKAPPMLEWYASRFAALPPRYVLDVGILKGGSVAFFEELWHPQRLVAVDISPEPLAALTEFIQRIDGADRIRPVYGVDQSDRRAMTQVMEESFSGQPPDLIIDDGCHFLDETRALFNITFPYLRPGGVYIIEDWAWAHWQGAWQEDGGPWPDRPALTSLALELAMLSASRGDLVESVEISSTFVVVRKGASAAVPMDFDLSSSYLTAGRLFLEDGFPTARQGPSRATETHSSIALAAARTASLEAALRAVKSSTSWKITAPMRRLGDLIRQVRRRA